MAIDYTGGTDGNPNAAGGYAYGFPITITGNGTVTSIGVNWYGVQSGNVRVALYSAGASKPGSLLAESASVAMTESAGWQDISISYAITAGSYWVAAQISATKGVYTNASSRSWYAKAYGTFDASWSGSSTQDSAAQWNMRVTYTTATEIDITCNLSVSPSLSRAIAVNRASSSNLSLAVIKAATTEILRPNGIGSETGFSAQFPASGEHWDKVDEAVADDAETYIRGYSANRDLFTIPNSSVGKGTIAKVTVFVRTRHYYAKAASWVKCSLRTHATTYDGDEQTPYTSYTDYSQIWTTNPYTSAAWTWDEINALEIGVSCYGSADDSFCTQAYIEINYIPSISRRFDSNRMSSSNLSLATTVFKSWGRTIVTTSNLSLAVVIDRALTWGRATSSNLSLTANLSRIRNRTISISTNLGLTTAISKALAWTRATSSNLSLTANVVRLRARTIATSSNLSLTTNISRALSYARGTSSNLNLTTNISRVLAWARATSSNLSLTTNLSRIRNRTASISANLSLATTISKAVAWSRATSSNLSLLSTISRSLSYARATSSNLSLASSISRLLAYAREVSSNLSLTANITRILGYVKAISSNLKLTANISRTMAYFRETSSNLSLTAIIASFQRLLIVKIVTTQYRRVKTVTTQYRLVNIVTSQFRNIKTWLSGG